MANPIFELAFKPRPVRFCLMSVTVFHIMFPFPIVDSPQLKIVMFSFAFLYPIDPLSFIIIPIHIVLGACPMWDTVHLLAYIGVFLLNNFFYTLLLMYRKLFIFRLNHDLLGLGSLFSWNNSIGDFPWPSLLLLLIRVLPTAKPTPHYYKVEVQNFNYYYYFSL